MCCKKTDSSSVSTLKSDSGEETIILHVYDGESKEFTSLTTYHGMIRIYTSETWPSRIFWGAVVVTCVTLFMIQGGVLLQFYQSHPAATQIVETPLEPRQLPFVSICPKSFRSSKNLYESTTQRNLKLHFSNEHSNTSTRDVVDKFSYLCEEVIEHVLIGRKKVQWFCHLAQTKIIDVGKCFTFGGWKSINSVIFSIYLKNTFSDRFDVHVHDEFDFPSRSNKIIRLSPWTHTKISIRVEEIHQLSLKDWGECIHSSEQYKNSHQPCVHQCHIKHIFDKFKCQPFFSETDNEICRMNQIVDYQSDSNHKCACQVSCSLRNYETDLLATVSNKKKRTILSFSLNTHLLKRHQQYQRFRQIDLMSYIGGVMGLFLGMSCITLLEVFVYIIKTIIGTLNNSRHEEFSRQFSTVSDNFKGSHEEIIITQKVETVQHSKLIDGEIYLSTKDTFFTTSTSTMGTLKTGLPYHRPERIPKRNSVYLGACDF